MPDNAIKLSNKTRLRSHEAPLKTKLLPCSTPYLLQVLENGANHDAALTKA